MTPDSADRALPPAEVARLIRRMRIVERLLTFAAVVFMLLGMWWADVRFGGRTQPVIITCFVVVTICVTLITVFAPFRCPRCGHRLWGSGKISLGSLDRGHCENCEVSFSAPKETDSSGR